MNRVFKYVFMLGLLLGVTTTYAQHANFRSFRETKGMVTSQSKGVYVWGAWEQSSTLISLDIKAKSIFVNDQNSKKQTTFQIFDKPQKWTVKKDYKYLNFECMESTSMEKYYVRLYEYDSGEYRITVMSPTSAVRYSVVYVQDDGGSDVNFDDV